MIDSSCAVHGCSDGLLARVNIDRDNCPWLDTSGVTPDPHTMDDDRHSSGPFAIRFRDSDETERSTAIRSTVSLLGLLIGRDVIPT